MKAFTPFKLGKVLLKNRVVRSSTAESMALPDGRITSHLITLYNALSEGGTGLIITGGAYVHISGRSYPGVIGVDQDAQIPGLSELAAACSLRGTVPLLQIYHCGRQKFDGTPALGPSSVRDPILPAPRELAIDEIDLLFSAFGDAARRAQLAGFPGVQISACNGHLIQQFLSPLTNRRRDKYGGSTENRARFLIEVCRAVRKRVRPDFLVVVKLAMSDLETGGLTEEEALRVSACLVNEGVDAIEVTAGTYKTGFCTSLGDIPVEDVMQTDAMKAASPFRKIAARHYLNKLRKQSRFEEAYFRHFSKLLKQHVSIPVILVGGIRTVATMEGLILGEFTDLVAMSRPLIRQPAIVDKMIGNPSIKPACTSCNRCVVRVASGRPLICYSRLT
ncbi:MAG: NADH:flavin oxidoreductase [Bacillota bacterium]